MTLKKLHFSLMNMRILPLAITCIMLAGNSIEAFAHSHQWVDIVLTLEIQDELIEGVKVDWHLLRNYSLDIQNRYDKDKDWVFSPEEQDELYGSAFLSIALPTFYLHLRFDDKQYASTVAENFSATIIHNEVVFSFYIPCQLPVFPSLPLAITAYDIGNYTSFDILDFRIQGNPELK